MEGHINILRGGAKGSGASRTAVNVGSDPSSPGITVSLGLQGRRGKLFGRIEESGAG